MKQYMLNQSNQVFIAEPHELAELRRTEKLGDELDHNKGSFYEPHDDYDYFTISAPDFYGNILSPKMKLDIWLKKNCLILCCNDACLRNWLDTQIGASKAPMPDQLLYLIFTHLLDGNGEALSSLEEEIERMEEKTVIKNPPDLTSEIIELRKKLLELERFDAAMADLLEEALEGPSRFISERVFHGLRLYASRINRYADSVSHLKDYLTQVRDAYQNQIDIGLNETMKIFTVIATIFLPLTLIAGWYGMNFSMPEYSFAGGYSIVIIVSICVVIGCILFFKKKRWF